MEDFHPQDSNGSPSEINLKPLPNYLPGGWELIGWFIALLLISTQVAVISFIPMIITGNASSKDPLVLLFLLIAQDIASIILFVLIILRAKYWINPRRWFHQLYFLKKADTLNSDSERKLTLKDYLHISDFLIAAAFLLVSMGIEFIFSELTVVRETLYPKEDLFHEYNVNQNMLYLLPMLFFVGIIGPIQEELLFRAYFLGTQKLRKRTWIGLIFSVFLFSLLHLGPGSTIYHIIPYLIAGLLISLSYLSTKRLSVPIIFHILNNCLYTLFYFSGFDFK